MLQRNRSVACDRYLLYKESQDHHEIESAEKIYIYRKYAPESRLVKSSFDALTSIGSIVVQQWYFPFGQNTNPLQVARITPDHFGVPHFLNIKLGRKWVAWFDRSFFDIHTYSTLFCVLITRQAENVGSHRWSKKKIQSLFQIVTMNIGGAWRMLGLPPVY